MEGQPGAHLSCAGLRLGGPAAGGQAGEQERSHCSPQRTHLHRWVRGGRVMHTADSLTWS
jgi:hypothetical protein